MRYTCSYLLSRNQWQFATEFIHMIYVPVAVPNPDPNLQAHEGPGSLLSYLKGKGWANELSAGCSSIQDDFTQFEVVHMRPTNMACSSVFENTLLIRTFFTHRQLLPSLIFPWGGTAPSAVNVITCSSDGRGHRFGVAGGVKHVFTLYQVSSLQEGETKPRCAGVRHSPAAAPLVTRSIQKSLSCFHPMLAFP